VRPAKSTNSFSPADMRLAHRRLQPARPSPVQVAVPRIGEPVGVRRPDTPSTAAPRSHRDDAARDAPRPSRASDADPRRSPAPAGTVGEPNRARLPLLV
jgi:hypothetical protein